MSDPKFAVVDLEKPYKLGDTEHKSIKVRKPGAGELRGTNLNALLNSNVDQMLTLLPRLTMPPISEQELADPDIIDVADFTALVNEVVIFLTPASLRG
ncbi:phage tail assembly protein [Asticcacaulis machinosus]|uniref:Phage tail assembly protein n=1 Tax=Asticcacaulis machinosus TaxID=2984211 RepID=A0ABT5HGK6_9CAUL|nr:phage tail assembly protein [Asticcacaulis machinosus]MDC7675389.1 phage tail assembly protein [Asticcacaulis machinosus]